MDQNSRVAYLIFKATKNDLSEAEESELGRWIAASEENEKFYNKALDPVHANDEIRNMLGMDKDRMQQRMDAIRNGQQSKLFKLHGRGYLAAAVLAGTILTTTWILLAHNTRPTHPGQAIASTADVGPGRDKAVLTLANGRTVVLDSAANGVISTQDGSQILKANSGKLIYQISKDPRFGKTDIAFNTLSTPNAGQYQLRLPDGTGVWLNNSSSLRYPVSFAGSDRTVFLNGEGYFEVAKDVNKPFTVIVGKQKIKVLSTNFDIAAYHDETAIKTVLVNGSIKVDFEKQSLLLRPGQQVVNKGDELVVSPANVRSAIAWKNGFFSFNKASVADILRQLSRWYDVKIEVDSITLDATRDRHFDGTIRRDITLREVLKVLQQQRLPCEYDETIHAIVGEKK
jgi:transmembrane sensor